MISNGELDGGTGVRAIIEVGGFEDLFSSRHGNYDVDPVVMVETVAAMVFTNALDRHRLERVFLQAQYNATLPPLAEVLQSFTDGVFPDAASLSWQTQHVQSVYLHVILTLQAQTSKVSAVVDEEIQRAIDYIQALLDSAIMNCEGKDSVYDLSSTCNHYRRLLVAIAGRKPFLNLLPTPEGPPI